MKGEEGAARARPSDRERNQHVRPVSLWKALRDEVRASAPYLVLVFLGVALLIWVVLHLSVE